MKLPGELPEKLLKLGGIGLVGERKALSLLCLGFYSTLFFLIWMAVRTEMPEWGPCFCGLTSIYVVAFVAVAAEWFWGRWFAIGIGYSGVTMTVMALVASRSLPPAMVVFGGMHTLLALCLMGEKMAARFDAQPRWRARWHLDEQGVVRVRRSVTRAASSLPALIMFALAPRDDQRALLLGVLAVGGLAGLLSRRTWGVLALGAGGVLGLWTGLTTDGTLHGEAISHWLGAFGGVTPISSTWLLLFASVLLCAAATPFLRPMARYLRG